MRPRPALAWAGFVLLQLSIPAVAQQVSVGLNPAVSFYEAKPGQVAQQEFSFENKGQVELVLELSAADAWYSDDGNRSFPRAGTSPQGAGAWMSTPPPELSIPPGKEKSFTGRIQIPDGTAPGTYYGAYLGKVRDGGESQANQGPLKKKETRAAGRMTARVAVIIVVDVLDGAGKKVVPAIRVVATDFKTFEGEPARFAYLVENPTMGGLRGTGQVLVLDATQNPIGKVDFSPYGLWPKQKLWIRGELAVPMPRGAYTAIGAFEAPEIPVISVTTPFEVKPQAPLAPPPQRAKPAPTTPPAKGSRAKKGTG